MQFQGKQEESNGTGVTVLDQLPVCLTRVNTQVRNTPQDEKDGTLAAKAEDTQAHNKEHRTGRYSSWKMCCPSWGYTPVWSKEGRRPSRLQMAEHGNRSNSLVQGGVRVQQAHG